MSRFSERLTTIMPTALVGSVVRTEGTVAAIAGFPAPVGAQVEIERHAGSPVKAEVIGFRDAQSSPFGSNISIPESGSTFARARSRCYG
jgi:flagellar biosynthesis/type III secretory pathway ATPase